MIERASPEPIKSIDLQISSLKARLIGLTQQKDRLEGNPVAERMVVTVETLPSVFNIRQGQRLDLDADAMTTRAEFMERVEPDLTYDPRIISLARRADKLARDIR